MYLKSIIVIFFLLLTARASSASTYLNIEDSAYEILTRLEAEGVIRTGLLSTRPISRAEAARLIKEAEANAGGKSEFIQSLVRSLKDRVGPYDRDSRTFKPVDSAYAVYAYSDSGRQTLNYNNNGDRYDRLSNSRFGFDSRLEEAGPFSAYLNPEFRHPDATEGEKNRILLRKGYAVYDFGWDVVIGRDSQWWGPGRHGALLLTNNAEPFTMVKIANPNPVTLPWIFRHLGPFGFTFFVTNLEKSRAVPEPYLYGLRLDFKPHANLEVGLEKTAFLGGRKGRSERLTTWIDSILPFSDTENRPVDDPGDQRAGFDLKWTIPSSFQPVQLYLEAAGEDEYHNLPNLWAFVGGAYFPRILNADRFDFRLEYATTRGRVNSPRIWYIHSIYESYTYKGDIIGHHIGTAADDLFLEVSYLVSEGKGRIFLSYDREEHNLYGAGSHETKKEITGGLRTAVAENIEAKAHYSRAWLKNVGNAPGPTVQEDLVKGEILYRF